MNKNTSRSIFGLSGQVVFIILALGILYYPMFSKLISYGWKYADYDHGMFILPISCYLIWSVKNQLVLRNDFSPRGFIFFFTGFLLYLYSAYNDFLFLQAITFVWIIASLCLLRLDTQSMRLIIFPVSYLVFMIPPPSLMIDTLTIPLKEISTQGAYWLLKAIQIPIKVSGSIIDVNGHQLFINDACSGFRSIVTLLALGALYIKYQPITIGRKCLAFLAVIPIGILANIFRIAITGFISYHFGIKYAEGFFHESSGIVLFAVSIFSLMGLAYLLRSRN